ncbi:MAG: 2OG-Fe(II) oxygenase [Planctomycetota bacterium]
MNDLVRHMAVDRLREQFAAAQPFEHVVLDDLLVEPFATEVAACLPPFAELESMGNRFETVNEHRKVQLVDPSLFPPPLERLLAHLQSREWLDVLHAITGVPSLESDARLIGGGLHATGRSGRLDVHVDFNYLPDVERFRRLNLLLYLNPRWEPSWGGELELWNESVAECAVRLAPVHGRCVIFATSNRSFHGTTRITCPEGEARYSLALYYYSHVPPPEFADDFHGTVFRARPDEWWKGRVLMPLETKYNDLKYRLRNLRDRLGGSDADSL